MQQLQVGDDLRRKHIAAPLAAGELIGLLREPVWARHGHNAAHACAPSDHRSALRLALAQAIGLSGSRAPLPGA